jgi:protein phosphatase
MSAVITKSDATLVLEPRPAAPRPLKVKSCGLTDPGRVRTSNEDSFLVSELRKVMKVSQTNLPQPPAWYSEERGHLFLVADGMGGHQAGERASALAVMAVEEFLLNTCKWFFQMHSPEEKHLQEELCAAMRQADTRVLDEANRNPELHGMGTTLTLAYAMDSDLYVVHVGDSRCYLWRAGELHRMTQDHTLVQELVRRGALSAEEAVNHRWRHVITNTVGGSEPGIQAEVRKVTLQPGDVILLCSDGLTEGVSDERVAEVLAGEPEPQGACEQLVREANDQGGKDNITVIVARFDAPQ